MSQFSQIFRIPSCWKSLYLMQSNSSVPCGKLCIIRCEWKYTSLINVIWHLPLLQRGSVPFIYTIFEWRRCRSVLQLSPDKLEICFCCKLVIWSSSADDDSTLFFFFFCHFQSQLLLCRYFLNFLVPLMSSFPQKPESETLACMWTVCACNARIQEHRIMKNKRRNKTKSM